MGDPEEAEAEAFKGASKPGCAPKGTTNGCPKASAAYAALKGRRPIRSKGGSSPLGRKHR